MKKIYARRTALLVIVILILAVPVFGQYYTEPKQSDVEGMSFEVTPYLWTFGLNGSVKIGRSPTISVDAGFSDIRDDLEAGFSIALSLRVNRFLTSFEYSNLELGRDVYPDNSRVDLDIDNKLTSWQMGYRIGETHFIDLYAGARYFLIKSAINVWDGPDYFRKEEWVDPFAGARLIIKPSDNFKIIMVSDIGGFGAGSDLSWQIAPYVRYEFPEVFSLSLGYRYMSVDYEKDDFLYDMESHGWIFGAGFRF